MRRILVGMLLVGLLVAPVAVMAADSPNYVALKLGMYQPGSKTLGISDPPSNMKFKTGFDGEVVFGRKIVPNLALELGAGMFTTKSNTFRGSDNTAVSGKFDVIPVTLNAKGIYPIDKLDLYGLAGLGYYRVKGKFGDTSKTKGVIGFQLGVGADYNFLPNVYAGLEFRYLWAKPDFGTNSFGKVKIDGMQLTADIGYRF